MVRLVSKLSLSGINFDIFPVDEVSISGNILLNIIILSVFFIEQEPQVVQFLFQAHNAHLI